MPGAWLEDGVTSDVTFRAWAATRDELVAAAVDATTAAMVAELDSLRAVERRTVTVEAGADEVIFLKDTAALLLRAVAVRVEGAAAPWRAIATLAGERIDPARHHLVADVKAVTWHGLRVERHGAEWQAEVTLDV